MNRKGMIASVLVLAIVLGTVAVAMAAVPSRGFPDMAGNAHMNQVAYLQALGIAKGDEAGRFNPSSNLTRQEFATFVTRLAGQEAAAAAVAVTKSSYHDDADIADWARGAVILAANNNWVKGYDDGKFHPKDPLTYEQAVTVLVRVLGHEATVTGTWPASHLIKAATLHLNEGVNVDAKAPIKRADMGRLLYNALFIEQLVQSGSTWQPAPALMGEKSVVGEVRTASATNIELYNGPPPGGPYSRALKPETVLIGADSLVGLIDVTVRLTLSTRVTDPAATVTVIEVLDKVSASTTLTFDRFDTDGSTDVLVFTDGTRVPYDSSNGNQATVSVNGSAIIAPKRPGNPAGFPTWAESLQPGDQVVATYTNGKFKHLNVTHYDRLDVALVTDAVVQSGSQRHSYVQIAGMSVGLVDTALTVNDRSATAADIKQHDVLRIAFRYEGWTNLIGWVHQRTAAAANPANAFVAHTLAATRSTAVGEVTSNRTTLPGPVYHTTLDTAEGSKQFEWVSGTLAAALPAEGSIVTLLLNADGKAVATTVAPTPIASGDYAILKGVTTAGGASEVSLDVNGTTFPMPVAAGAIVGPAGHINTDRIGEALLINIVGGKVTHAQTALSMSPTVYDVVSVDAATGVVIIRFGPETIVTEGTLQYEGIGAAGIDVGLPAALQAGDKVKIGHTGVTNTAGIKLLLRQP